MAGVSTELLSLFNGTGGLSRSQMDSTNNLAVTSTGNMIVTANNFDLVSVDGNYLLNGEPAFDPAGLTALEQAIAVPEVSTFSSPPFGIASNGSAEFISPDGNSIGYISADNSGNVNFLNSNAGTYPVIQITSAGQLVLWYSDTHSVYLYTDSNGNLQVSNCPQMFFQGEILSVGSGGTGGAVQIGSPDTTQNANLSVDNSSNLNITTSNSGGVTINSVPVLTTASLPNVVNVALFHDQSDVVTGNGIVSTFNGSQFYSTVSAQASSSVGDSFSQTFVSGASTDVTVSLIGMQTASGGTANVFIDGVNIAEFNPVDMYSASTVNNYVYEAYPVTISTAGEHTLTVTVTGQAVGSTGYDMPFTKFSIVK